MITHRELILLFERNLKKAANKKGNISVKDLERETNICLHQITVEEQENTAKKKIMFVEDGSVDTDELMESLAITNPEIKVVVYRQGSRPPEITDIQEA